MKELLALGLAPCIPGPTSRRIWTLVVWIISVQNLPSEVLSPAKRDVVCVLKRALEGEIGKDQAKLDALQVADLLDASSFELKLSLTGFDTASEAASKLVYLAPIVHIPFHIAGSH